MGNSTRNRLCENPVGHSISEDAAELHCRDTTAGRELGNCDRALGRYVLCDGKVVNDVQGGEIK